jgi:hypothetical protein
MNILTRHWELKLLAVAFSAVLWFFVVTSEKTDLIVSAPLELDGLPTGLEVMGDKPSSIDVQLQGLRLVLARLGPDQVKARLSLTGARAGEVQIGIRPEHVQVPVGITVLRVTPSHIRLTLAAPPT